MIYDWQSTALLVIDPYNDFISEGGKVWDRLRSVAEANGCVPHMRSSGFANTDLDLLLKRHGIRRLIVVGLLAHTCVDSTVRFAASYSDAHLYAALEIGMPNYASAIVTTAEAVDSLRSTRSSAARDGARQFRRHARPSHRRVPRRRAGDSQGSR